MLNRENASFVHRRCDDLLYGHKSQNSRSIRRFLTDLVASNKTLVIVQSFTYDEGFEVEQLKAFRDYALRSTQRATEDLKDCAPNVKFQSLVFDEGFEMVGCLYEANFDLASASLKQLREVVAALSVLSANLMRIGRNVNQTVLHECPTYELRNLPCSIQPDEDLWCISGHDKQSASGVLEWCYDKEDAERLLFQMKRFPTRFRDIKAAPFIDFAVKQSFELEM